ncbi:MAG: S8 family serine peptidase [Nitrosomonadales bacterium]|nr:S8 family serine peptidase [Nitrosomonadales bacterium]
MAKSRNFCQGLPGFPRYLFGLLIALALSACGSNSPSTDPVALAVPTGVSATPRDANNLISWAAVSGATSYNIYWSTVTGVSKANGTKISLANNPQAHTGLINGTAYYYVVTAVAAGSESGESAQVSATPVAAGAAEDPLYFNGDQWHLKNTGQSGAMTGEDINVEPAWLAATPHKGNGIRIAVVDDGLEIGHEDLAANVAATGLSYNYVTGSADPTNDTADMISGHGTAVAGIAAARDLNGLGVRGVAPRANLVGYNLLQNSTASNEADAVTRGSPNVHISSNSWGAPDGNGTLDAPLLSWRTAIDSGLANGRGGLGTLYIWAAGNGAPTDNSNYDGYANYHGVIAVAAVNDQGKQATYSEPGANVWISAPGGEYCSTRAITTTDRSGAVGDNPSLGYATDYANQNYTRCMNGTSAATPAVAGAIALMLEARPNLGWRDVQLILAETARKNDTADTGWTTGVTVPPYHFNHKYGFGVVDASAAVTRALSWTNVGPQLTYPTALATANLPIPDFPGVAASNPGVSNTINVAGSGIANIEFIEITFSATHTYSGDLAVTLTSPTGTVSRLSETHLCPLSCTTYSGWVFGSTRHLGEAADGNWTLNVQDGSPVDTGTFQTWKLKFYGR